MSPEHWPVTDVLLESPSQRVGMVPHDLMGHGTVHIEGDSLHLAVRPRGLTGLVPHDEKRVFPLEGITGWDVAGDIIEFTAGLIGMVATDGAEVPVHIGHLKCAGHEAASGLTDAAVAAGLDPSRVSRH
jgi:hypothetical protein